MIFQAILRYTGKIPMHTIVKLQSEFFFDIVAFVRIRWCACMILYDVKSSDGSVSHLFYFCSFQLDFFQKYRYTLLKV